MGSFQELMKSGSVCHREYSGIFCTHKPYGGPDQRLSVSLVKLSQVEREESGKVLIYLVGTILVLADDLDTPVTRSSKFVMVLPSETAERTYSFDDQENFDRAGTYLEVPIYSDSSVRTGPSDGYKRSNIGR